MHRFSSRLALTSIGFAKLFGMIAAVQQSSLCLIGFALLGSIQGRLRNFLGVDVCAGWIEACWWLNVTSLRRKNRKLWTKSGFSLFHVLSEPFVNIEFCVFELNLFSGYCG